VTQAATSRLLSDATIARRAAGGNRRAFAAIFERYHQDLYRYCVAILGSSEDAHDAVQNTMLKVLHALPGETRDMKLKPWLYRIAHNESIDLIRARRGTEPIDVEAHAGHAGPDEEVEARDRIQRLIADIAELPARQRGALVMREMGGLSYEQIGDALQTSPGVARQTLYEARLSLRQMSEGREMPCQEAMRAISEDDGRVLRRRDIRAHLKGCDSCQAFRAEIAGRRRDFAVLAPLPAAASTAILHGLLGGTAGGSAAAVGAGGKALVSATAIKSAAAVCAVSAVGLLAANHGGIIHLGIGDHSAPAPAPASSQSRAAVRPVTTTRANPIESSAKVAARRRVAKGRRAIRRRSIAKPAASSARAAPAPAPHAATMQASHPHGRHLGWSTAPGHEKQAQQGKEKTHTGGSQAGSSHGQGAHSAPKTHHATKPPKAHPTHPAHPDQPKPAQTPEAAPGSSAAVEAGNGQHGKPSAE
jgi:RNA polymerase sigma factor (sigma-70 family)